MSDKDLYLRSVTDKGETGLPENLRLRSIADKEGAPPAYYHGLKVQGVGELALCDVGTSPLRMRKGSTTYGIVLVATDDPNASGVRVQTGAGMKAIRKYT